MAYDFHRYYYGDYPSTATMPWNIAVPPAGDKRRSALFQAVGRALSDWEQAELNLVRLYATFIGLPEFTIPALKLTALEAYSQAAGFRGRADLLESVADAFFVQNPNQMHEGRFTRIVNAARQFSFRRNDIAHGIARRTWPKDAPNNVEWMLLPAAYMGKRFTSEGGPAYAYSSAQIRELAGHFEMLGFHARTLAWMVAPQAPSPETPL